MGLPPQPGRLAPCGAIAFRTRGASLGTGSAPHLPGNFAPETVHRLDSFPDSAAAIALRRRSPSLLPGSAVHFVCDRSRPPPLPGTSIHILRRISCLRDCGTLHPTLFRIPVGGSCGLAAPHKPGLGLEGGGAPVDQSGGICPVVSLRPFSLDGRDPILRHPLPVGARDIPNGTPRDLGWGLCRFHPPDPPGHLRRMAWQPHAPPQMDAGLLPHPAAGLRTRRRRLVRLLLCHPTTHLHTAGTRHPLRGRFAAPTGSATQVRSGRPGCCAAGLHGPHLSPHSNPRRKLGPGRLRPPLCHE